jgi:two-component system, response regulator / RNA-binding antiterminator
MTFPIPVCGQQCSVDTDDFEAQLETAMVTRPTIEQAKGVLVQAQCATPEKAFAELRRVAQDYEVTVPELAAALVDVAAAREPQDPRLREAIIRAWGDLANC